MSVRILVNDDEAAIVQALKTLPARDGYEVVTTQAAGNCQDTVIQPSDLQAPAGRGQDGAPEEAHSIETLRWRGRRRFPAEQDKGVLKRLYTVFEGDRSKAASLLEASEDEINRKLSKHFGW